ncbi:MAG: hypothetical protein EBU63_01640 [Alphaproteobacteria bacterium]|nr:hypothetical protein [Alphaproteobacteria bacterium]
MKFIACAFMTRPLTDARCDDRPQLIAILTWGALRHCWFIYWFKKGCVMDNANLFQLGIGLATGAQAEDIDCSNAAARN